MKSVLAENVFTISGLLTVSPERRLTQHSTFFSGTVSTA